MNFLFTLVLIAQVPVSLGKAVGVTWNAANCGPDACAYYVSRVTVPKGTTTCPRANGNNYTPLNYNDPVTVADFIDPTVPTKQTVCYVVQTAAGGTTTPSSIPAGPIVVP